MAAGGHNGGRDGKSGGGGHGEGNGGGESDNGGGGHDGGGGRDDDGCVGHTMNVVMDMVVGVMKVDNMVAVVVVANVQVVVHMMVRVMSVSKRVAVVDDGEGVENVLMVVVTTAIVLCGISAVGLDRIADSEGSKSHFLWFYFHVPFRIRVFSTP
ncbi:uncharacterized protein LOC126609127 [Malus sylvestris]|uniref:uncharacterized protein LOC126609127 n=1 Tax=Malus sylvestris TaxID=3752 RepID=UPI0021AC3610|nr:uncharacterized protein LOC126609127 [Malus sylvestris]